MRRNGECFSASISLLPLLRIADIYSRSQSAVMRSSMIRCRTDGRLSRVSIWIERTLWCAGFVLILAYSGLRGYAEHGRRHAFEQLEDPVVAETTDLVASRPVATGLWSDTRIREYQRTLSLTVEPPIALLRIARIALEVPVFSDERELHLIRGAGLVTGMQPPGIGGNMGVAGPRDGFFRLLKDARVNDVIELQTRQRLYAYRITAIRIVSATDTSLLADTPDPRITLVTCYPFYHVGAAPQRYVVKGAFERAVTIAASRNVP